MMQSQTRRSPRLSDHIEGPVARGKREHRQEMRKLWISVRPVLIVGLLLAAFHFLGVTTK